MGYLLAENSTIYIKVEVRYLQNSETAIYPGPPVSNIE